MTNQSGWTLVICAGRTNHLRLFDLALQHRCAIDHQDVEGLHRFDVRRAMGGREVVEALLARGASVHLADHRGETAFFKARFWNRQEIARLLMDAGASR